MQATPFGDACTDAIGVCGLDVLAAESAIVEPAAIQIRPVQRVAALDAAAVRTTAPPRFGVQASW
jgi:hypothetical protein